MAYKFNVFTGNFDIDNDDQDLSGYVLKSGSLTQITTRDHDLLTGLTDDDHTQYALLAGRAGGQSLSLGKGTSPSYVLDIVNDSTTDEYALSIRNSAANTTGNKIRFYQSRGTIASPSVNTAGDTLGGFCFYGYTNTAKESAGIYAVAKTNFTASSAESYLSFWNTANSSTTNTERMRLTSTGLALGAFNAAQKLHSPYNDQWVADMNTMGAPTVTPSTSGGYMADGSYYYVICALDRFGGSTVKGTESSVATISGGGGAGSVALSWTALNQAYQYKIYRTTSSGTYTTPALIATLDGTVTSYTDIANAASIGAPPATTTAYSVKLHSGTASISQIASNTVQLTSLAQVSRNSTWIQFETLDASRVLNYGHGISNGWYSGSYFRAYGSRTIDAPTVYAGNLHFNITLPSIATPTLVASETGGSMGAGTYYYKVVAEHTNSQTIVSAESSGATIVGSTGKVTINLTASPQAKAYKIYRTTVSGTYTSPSYIATLPPGTLSYIDTAASPSAGTPASTTMNSYPIVATWLRTERPSSAAVKLYYDLRGNLCLDSTATMFKNTSNTQTLGIKNGTAPSSNLTNVFQLYSADISAGKASPHFRNEAGDIVKLYKVNTYTQTYATAARTVNAYTTDAESGAYTGIDNAQAGTPYAQLTDLNSLRTAYENLRASYDNLLQVTTALIDDLQSTGLIG